MPLTVFSNRTGLVEYPLWNSITSPRNDSSPEVSSRFESRVEDLEFRVQVLEVRVQGEELDFWS